MGFDASAVRALTFDHYGTLFDKGACAGIIDDAFPGRGADMAKTWFKTIKKYCWLNGMMGRYQTWDDLTKRALVFTCKEAGEELPGDLNERLIEADLLLPPYPEVPAALERLAARFDLYVLSMGAPWMIEASQKNAGVEMHFKGILSTEGIQVYKPDKRAYDFGVSQLGLPKEQIGFVSSNSFDVMGGVNYGFPTFWINRTGAPLDELGFEADIVVDGLDKLADALGT